MSNDDRTLIDLLPVNRYSRSGRRLEKMKGLVIHWVANPLSSPKANRDFFASRMDGKKGFGSAHEIIGIDGKRIICIPEGEIAYHVGSKTYTEQALDKLGDYPNGTTYGIELCHKDWTGEFTDSTFESVVERCVELCEKYRLDPMKDIWTHQEVVGWKACPKWFAEHPQEFDAFKNRVNEAVKMRKLESWQKELGREALAILSEQGIINTPEEWDSDEKLAQAAPTWLVFALLARMKEDE